MFFVFCVVNLMQIVCNGENREVASGLSVSLFLGDLSFDPDTVVVECDGRIVPRDQYDSWILTEGARLELIRFVGGG